jgi:hypothetical protein
MAFGKDSVGCTLNDLAVLKKDESLWKKRRQVRSTTKWLLAVFFDQDGVVRREFVAQHHTTNKKHYLQVLLRLRDSKRPEKWSSGYWQVHHDNAPAHSAQLVQHFVAKHEIPYVQQPPYSPGLTSRDFFSKMKSI